MIIFNIIDNIRYIIENPNNKPVMKRLILLDSYFDNNCVTPSIINGISIKIQYMILILGERKNMKGDNKYPKSIPVQRAQIGN